MKAEQARAMRAALPVIVAVSKSAPSRRRED
jgi:hypothetical protein